jgi:hypothetical protein
VSWTTPADLRAQVTKLWNQGKILASLAKNEPLFPRRLSLVGPAAPEMVSRFDDVRAWVQALLNIPYFRIETRSFRHRELGANTVPAEAWIDSFDDAVAVIGKQREAGRFVTILEATKRRQPEWVAWLARKPLVALELAADWERFMDIAAWCRQHPRSGLYLRQIDLPGVHTKFIEAHRGTLIELLDLALPAEAIDRTANGAGQFDTRYGFREKPARIRFRVLDKAKMQQWAGGDIAMTEKAFAQLDPPVSRVFITENEINFLAFPPVNDALIIFGAGYGFERSHHANWLSRCHIHYWGDIDTHGFAILDQLRHRFAHACSVLMDQETFMSFRHLWGTEPAPTKRDLATLTPAEQALYDDLRDNRYGKNLRLEQEKIGFNRVTSAVADL